MTKCADESNDRTNPDSRGRGETGDMARGLAQNHPCTQKSDPCENALGHPTNCVRVSKGITGRLQRGNGGGRGAEADEAMSSKARGFAVKLPVQPQ